MKCLGAGFVICMLCLSCGSPKAMQKTVMKPNESDTALTDMEYRHLDTLEVTPERNGETKDEMFEAMDHLVENRLDILTVGQYLQPTKLHIEVAEYIHPDLFEMYKVEGEKRGIK